MAKLAFSNLLVNACKYGDGEIDFDVSGDGETVKTTVTNACKGGIPLEYRERIFEPCFRIPGSREGGFGLGLYLAREMMESQKGTLVLEDSKGDAVAFSMSLPRPAKAT